MELEIGFREVPDLYKTYPNIGVELDWIDVLDQSDPPIAYSQGETIERYHLILPTTFDHVVHPMLANRTENSITLRRCPYCLYIPNPKINLIEYLKNGYHYRAQAINSLKVPVLIFNTAETFEESLVKTFNCTLTTNDRFLLLWSYIIGDQGEVYTPPYDIGIYSVKNNLGFPIERQTA